MYYFKRNWDETTGEQLTDSWGTSIYYFETTESGEVLRQVQIFSKGQKLRYDSRKIEDDYGKLAESPLDFDDFIEFKIEKDEFESIWR